MFKKFLGSLEDPEKPLLGPNYRFTEFLGIILPKNKWQKIGYIILHDVASYFVLSQYIELYVVKSDMDEILTNLKISMLSSMCVAKTNTAMLWQEEWKDVFAYVTRADKYERENPTKNSKTIIEKYTKYCRILTYSYWALVFSTFVTVTTTPLMRYLSSSSFREHLRTGEEKFPHIFSSWMPFDKYKSPGSWITVVWHSCICAYGAAIPACFDSCAITIMVFFGGKLELMRARCRDLVGNGGQGISDREASHRVAHLHQMHVELTQYFRKFNSLLSPILYVYMIMCSLMLCASVYQFTSSQTATQKLLIAEFLVFGIVQLFLFCWHSTDVMVKSENLSMGPYESDWTDVRSGAQRRGLLLLMGQFRTQHIFTAGPFTNLTLYTFIMILKGAYSYYTLLRD